MYWFKIKTVPREQDPNYAIMALRYPKDPEIQETQRTKGAGK